MSSKILVGAVLTLALAGKALAGDTTVIVVPSGAGNNLFPEPPTIYCKHTIAVGRIGEKQEPKKIEEEGWATRVWHAIKDVFPHP